jgi:hypothetical protein
MATLYDFAHTLYPRHQLAPWEATGAEAPAALATHTVVVEVIGRRKARDVHDRLRRLTRADIRALDVEPADSTVVPSADEDRGGPVDVPPERVAVAGVVGAVFGALVLGLLAWAFIDSSAGVVIGVLFGLGLGAAVGVIAGGGRHAGQRATVQADGAAGRTISLLAVLLDAEDEALELVRKMEAAGVDPDVEYRIVGADGGWRVPNT